MPGKGQAAGRIIKWGVKYGPHVVVLAQQAKEPAMKAAQSALDRQKAKRRAVEHATTVRDGSVLKTFDPTNPHGEPVWVVFSGDDPIAAHPATTTPIGQLIANSDLSMRTRPSDLPSPADRLRQLPKNLPRRPGQPRP
jgi:hypothetical protein